MTSQMRVGPWFLSILVLVLSACGSPAVELTLQTSTPTAEVASAMQTESAETVPTPTPIPVGVMEPTTTPSRVPTPSPTASSPSMLPAPLYFLSDGQIVRLESDGVTLTQLTQEEEPILDFDVSPSDARLIYVAGNSLIEADPQFGTRIVKLSRDPVDRQDAPDLIERALTNPRFSPDGDRIAFGLGGVNIMQVGESTEFETVLASASYPDPNDPPRQPVRFFRPDLWSPDGRHLSVEFSYWPEAGGLAILDVNSGVLTELNSDDPNSVLCCDWAWSDDGSRAFIASALFFYGNPGLAVVDPDTGETQTLLQTLPPGDPSPANPIRFFRSVWPDPDGVLYTFMAEAIQLGENAPYALYAVDPDSAELTRLNGPGPQELAHIAWATDGSGAVVVDSSAEPPAQQGPLLWFSLDEGEPRSLPAVGSHPRWGIAEFVRSRGNESDEPTGSGPMVEALVPLNVRSGPGTAYPIVGDLAPGDEAEILGIDPSGSWWQIRYPLQGSSVGWVIGDEEFTQADAPDEVAVVEPPPLPRATGRIFYSAAGPQSTSAVYVLQVNAGAAPTLVLENVSQPQLHRDGRRLALRSSRSDLLGIASYDLASGDLVRISSHVEDSLPSWSPDGTQIVFASTRHGDRRWRIYLQNWDRPGTAGDFKFGLDPSWHPSQNQIAYKGCDETGERCGIWLVNSAGGDASPITQNKTDSRPVWSPDGDTVVFMSESRDGNWEVYTVSVPGGSVTRLTNNPALDGLPAVSPDGSRVAFVSNRDGSWGIWIVPISGGLAQRAVIIGADLPNWLEQGIDWVP